MQRIITSFAQRQTKTKIFAIPQSRSFIRSVFGLGNVLNNSKEQIKALEKQIHEDPTNWKAHHDLASLHLQQKNFESAIQSFKKAFEIQPQNIETLKKIGQLYDANEKIEEAISFFKEVTTKYPDNLQTLEMLAYLYGRQGQFEEAANIYKKAIEKNPNPKSLYNLGLALMQVFLNISKRIITKINRLEESVKYLNKVLELQPNHQEAHFHLASLLTGVDNTEARKHLETIIKLNPKNGAALLRLGLICEQQEDFGAAKEHFLNALEELKDNGQLHYHLGNIYFQNKQYKDAIENFNKAIYLDPDYTEKHRLAIAISFNTLGLEAAKEGKLEDALSYFKSASIFDLRSEQIRYNIALAHLELNNYGEALPLLKGIISLNKEHADAATAIGYIYRQLGDNEEAVSWFRRALSINPKHAAAKMNLTAAMKKVKEAHPGVSERPEVKAPISFETLNVKNQEQQRVDQLADAKLNVLRERYRPQYQQVFHEPSKK